MHSFLYYYLIFINCTAFVVYGADKAFAKLHSWRVPEIVLLFLAALGGSAGAFIAMQLFRHKTQHLKFIFGVPLIFFLQVAVNRTNRTKPYNPLLHKALGLYGFCVALITPQPSADTLLQKRAIHQAVFRPDSSYPAPVVFVVCRSSILLPHR